MSETSYRLGVRVEQQGLYRPGISAIKQCKWHHLQEPDSDGERSAAINNRFYDCRPLRVLSRASNMVGLLFSPTARLRILCRYQDITCVRIDTGACLHYGSQGRIIHPVPEGLIDKLYPLVFLTSPLSHKPF